MIYKHPKIGVIDLSSEKLPKARAFSRVICIIGAVYFAVMGFSVILAMMHVEELMLGVMIGVV